jgi:hypothetical protein
MPMWCTSSDNVANRAVPIPHHRIVRIPPGEAVVLNSAERAPYLLLIEILSDDLDFDPSKRANKDVLRKVVTKDIEQRGSVQDFGLSANKGPATPNVAEPDVIASTPASVSQPAFYPNGTPRAPSANPPDFSVDDEEIDLVEQLYGDDQPLRSRTMNIEDSIVLPPKPKNRELDMAAWARSSPSFPSIPTPDDHQRNLRHSPNSSQNMYIAPSPSISRASSFTPPRTQATPTPVEHELTHQISLDEYSERMRTAAILLAQLNADQSRDAVPASPKLNGLPRAENIADRSGKSLPEESRNEILKISFRLIR